MPSAYNTAVNLLKAQSGIAGKAELVVGQNNLIRLEINGRYFLLNLDALLNNQEAPIFRG